MTNAFHVEPWSRYVSTSQVGKGNNFPLILEKLLASRRILFVFVKRLEPFHCSPTILQKQTFLLKFSFIDISMPHIGVVYRVPFPCVLEIWYSSSKVHLTEKQSMRMYAMTKTCEVNLRLLSIHSVQHKNYQSEIK